MQKQFFAYWDSVDLGVISSCVLMALDPISMTFGILETGFKFKHFCWLSGGGPKLRAHGQLVVNGIVLAPIAVTRQYGADIQHTKYSIKLAGRKGLDVSMILKPIIFNFGYTKVFQKL